MATKTRQFIDDGWAIWIDGDDRSTVYLNEWINPKGKSYVDVGIRAYGAKEAKELNVYIPFEIAKNEIKDLSVELNEDKILRGLFNTNCILDTERNGYTSELRYDQRRVTLVHLSENVLKIKRVSVGTVVTVVLDKIQNYITNDEAYILFRIPHRTLDKIFMPKINASGRAEHFKELLSSPVITHKYGYSIRINEARLLPPQINRIKVLQQQRIRKVLVTLSLDEEYELNDSNCYRIRRLEEDLYQNYAPPDYCCAGAITYQWMEERSKNMKAHYNFYFDILHNHISKNSVLLYVLIILSTAVAGSGLYDLIKTLIMMIR